MAMSARKLESEAPNVEPTAGKLEAHLEHMQSDMSDLKTYVNRLNDKIDSIKEALAAIDLRFEKLNSARAYDRIWFLLTAATLLVVMAKGFKWI